MSVTTPINLLNAVEEALRPQDWTAFAGIDTNADGRAEFLKTMKRVKLGEGQNPLAVAWANRVMGEYKTQLRDHEYLTFLSLAESLQKVMKDEPIYLPCREVAGLIGVGRTTVSAYRDFAIDDGYLELVAPHSFGGHKATKFRFHYPPASMSKKR